MPIIYLSPSTEEDILCNSRRRGLSAPPRHNLPSFRITLS